MKIIYSNPKVIKNSVSLFNQYFSPFFSLSDLKPYKFHDAYHWNSYTLFPVSFTQYTNYFVKLHYDLKMSTLDHIIKNIVKIFSDFYVIRSSKWLLQISFVVKNIDQTEMVWRTAGSSYCYTHGSGGHSVLTRFFKASMCDPHNVDPLKISSKKITRKEANTIIAYLYDPSKDPFVTKSEFMVMGSSKEEKNKPKVYHLKDIYALSFKLVDQSIIQDEPSSTSIKI